MEHQDRWKDVGLHTRGAPPSNFLPRIPIDFHIRFDEMKHLKRLSVVSLAHECLGRQVLELAPSPRLDSIELGGGMEIMFGETTEAATFSSASQNPNKSISPQNIHIKLGHSGVIA